MDPKTNLIIILMMIFLGGFIIGFTFWVFVVFARWMERERIAGERFRAEHDLMPKSSSKPDDP